MAEQLLSIGGDELLKFQELDRLLTWCEQHASDPIVQARAEALRLALRPYTKGVFA